MRDTGVSPSKRMSGCQGSTKRMGQEMWGIAFSRVSRSISAFRTRLTSRYSRYRNPPWNSLVEAEEVAEARSFISARVTLRPRPAASRAMPQPLMPPPMMKRSWIGALSVMWRKPRLVWPPA